MVKVNYKLLPIKAHFFFFMAALGPILHQLNVFGKQLGVSEVVIGGINFFLPFMFLVAKPIFGMIVDYFLEQRKLIFILLVSSMNIFYVLMYFIPQPSVPVLDEYTIVHPREKITFCDDADIAKLSECGEARKAFCNSPCLLLNASMPMIILQGIQDTKGLRLCIFATEPTEEIEIPAFNNETCLAHCALDKVDESADCLYGTAGFWTYVMLMSLGTICFNVANSVSDAICFDILGDGAEMGYGKQRVWGTIGFGLTAFISGFAVDAWSSQSASKDYSPAFLIILIFGIFDFYCCTKLKLPPLPRSENIFKDLAKLLRHKHVSIFIVFCALAGIVDSFIIYYMFWYLEDLASNTGDMANIKLLEGLIIAAETLVGEVIFFMISDRILKLVGYGHSLTLCFMAYAVRLGLISVISNPWWFIAVELFLQGPTYAMSYTTIVVYASAVSPKGTSASMQGIVAGMDDGFGYAVGSLLGSVILKNLGGSNAYKVFASIALACGICHFILYEFFFKKMTIPTTKQPEVEYKTPDEAVKATIVAGNETEGTGEKILQ